MDVIPLTTGRSMRAALRDLCAWADDVRIAYAWVSTAGDHWAALDLSCVSTAVVGTHFKRSEPAALRELSSRLGTECHIVDSVGPVFHPKLVVGICGDSARMIAGSSNLTKGGFSTNSEFNLLVAGPRNLKCFVTALEYVDRAAKDGRCVDATEQWFRQYELDFLQEQVRSELEPAGNGQDDESDWSNANTVLQWSWTEFHNHIVHQDEFVNVFPTDQGSYMEQAEYCWAAFREHSSFAAMPRDVRRRVGGLAGYSSGYFGRVDSRGKANQHISDAPAILSNLLEQIPASGPISRGMVEDFLESAASGRLSGIRLGVGTRLLALKRPDRFVTSNKANARKLGMWFRTDPTTIRGYCDMLEKVWESPWAQAQGIEPDQHEQIHRFRVALLDALVVER